MDVTQLYAGNAMAWVESIDADESVRYDEPSGTVADPRLYVRHIRVGLADIMVMPEGVDPRTGDLSWKVNIHTHHDMEEARKCFRNNREGNERRSREFQVNPERATQRALAEKQGIPLEIIDAMIPLEGGTSMVDEINDRLRGITPPPRPQPPIESPVSGGPVGWDGPTGFYL